MIIYQEKVQSIAQFATRIFPLVQIRQWLILKE